MAEISDAQIAATMRAEVARLRERYGMSAVLVLCGADNPNVHLEFDADSGSVIANAALSLMIAAHNDARRHGEACEGCAERAIAFARALDALRLPGDWRAVATRSAPAPVLH